MVALEINGQQHYNSDGTLKDYYQNRHDLIESKGWQIIEIHYSQCFSDENISKFLGSVVEIQQRRFDNKSRT
jgi:very-short-patch-repair endonuclease